MKKSEMTFEQAVTRLGEIVRSLEDGQAPLDQSLALYQEGVGLLRFCNDKLDGAEKTVRQLQIVEPEPAQNNE